MSQRKIERLMSVRLYFDAFETGIIELDSHERGVYLTLCLRFYATRGRVKDDDKILSRSCGCTTYAYRKTKEKLLDLGKIYIEDGYIFQDRAIKELASAEERVKGYNEYLKSKRSKKDRKNIKKSSEVLPEKSNKNIESSNAHLPVSVGYGAPNGANRIHRVAEEEKPEDQEPAIPDADASAPARESGGGLSSPPLCDEANAAMKRIRQHPGQLVSNRDKDLFKAAVHGWRDGVFLVCPDWLDRHGARFATVLSDEGCRAEPIGVKPDLKLVRTG